MPISACVKRRGVEQTAFDDPKPRIRVVTERAMELTQSDPIAVRLTKAVQSGELDELARLLAEEPGLANVRILGRKPGGWRTPLHAAADWPGYFPNGPAVVRLLIEAGADPSARCEEGPSETPL